MSSSDRLKFGSVHVHKEVLAEIVVNAVSQVKGVRFQTNGLGQAFSKVFGMKSFPGIQIHVNPEGGLNVDVSVIVQYGLNLPMVGQDLQDTIKKALEKSVDVQLKDINVNIQGVDKRGQS